MALNSSISLTTRIADLDSLRHVNNRVYEELCAEGRYRLLEGQGYSLQTLLDRALTLRPVASFVRFSKQQKAGVNLQIETEAFPMADGLILWNHHIRQADGETACYLQAQTQTLDHHRKPVELLPALGGDPAEVLIEKIPQFSGDCLRVASVYSAIFTDLDVLRTLPLAAYWRMFEEGRHMFGEQLGLTLETLVPLDTHIFWVAGTYRCYKPIRPGQKVIINTWLERIDRIRAYFRQEITAVDGSDRFGASREQHLIVSLSRARPKNLPPELEAVVESYVEFQN